ncbi:hypothetical protein MKW98_010654 [Papaver atlanticum]|uniref:Uncharacterized protein n=1 Tax=Papaver atlanticum TaxID=357466 RepID=A0AAD4SGW3_9MAGN|nr:hypothetical protein MKW98_010654 [Papaver atlanticum]
MIATVKKKEFSMLRSEVLRGSNLLHQYKSYIQKAFLSGPCRTLHMNCAVSIKKNTRRWRYMYMNGDCFASKTFLRDGLDENGKQQSTTHEIYVNVLPTCQHKLVRAQGNGH